MRLPPGARWRARIPPAAGDREPVLPFSWPRQAAAALQCRRQQRRQQVQALDQRGAVRSHIGIRHDSQRRHAAVEQGRHVLDRRLARLRAPRPHIARRRIDQPGIGLEAIIGAEHRLVPMPQAHPFGGQDDHARPGVQQRPGFRQRRAPELLELGAQLVDRRTARLLDAQRQDRAQRGAVHVPAMAPGGLGQIQDGGQHRDGPHPASWAPSSRRPPRGPCWHAHSASSNRRRKVSSMRCSVASPDARSAPSS